MSNASTRRRGAEQPLPTHHRYAGDKAQQLRDQDAVEMGTDTGEAIQDRD